MKIVADAHLPYVQDYFSSYGELVLIPGREITAAQVKDADMLLVRSVTVVDKNLLTRSSVRFVGSVTTGHDHVDINFLNEAGIAFSTAHGFNAPPVADYVMSVIAFLQKKKLLSNGKQRAAIIGAGQIGSLVAKKLSYLGMEILLCDPLRAEKEKNFSSIDLDAISQVDLISLHVPLTTTPTHATKHFINAAFLQQQKPGCILLNSSRGAVIHTDDLLKKGQHLHWCFDVFDPEPNIRTDILSQAYLTTPHIAGYSIQSKMRGMAMMRDAAVAKKIIEPHTQSTPDLPSQHLSFAGKSLRWQDIVLGIFNPSTISSIMKSKLISAKHKAALFDEMRHQFNYRHEFAFTRITADIHPDDKKIVKQLGISYDENFSPSSD